MLLHERVAIGRRPPKADIHSEVLELTDRDHPALRPRHHRPARSAAARHEAARGAWETLPAPLFADILTDRIAFAWHAMDAFYEEDERIVGTPPTRIHRIDIRQTSRELTPTAADTLIASSQRRWS